MEWKLIFQSEAQRDDAIKILSNHIFDKALVKKRNNNCVIVSNIHIDKVKHIMLPSLSSKGLIDAFMTFCLQKNEDMFSAIWPSGIFSDLEIIIDNRRFKVHKAILASVSSYFHKLLEEDSYSSITIDDIDSDLFKDLLDMMYGKRIYVKGMVTLNMLVMAQFFAIDDIPYLEILNEIDVNSREIHEYVELFSTIRPNDYINLIYEPLFLRIIPHNKLNIHEILSTLPLELQNYWQVEQKKTAKRKRSHNTRLGVCGHGITKNRCIDCCDTCKHGRKSITCRECSE